MTDLTGAQGVIHYETMLSGVIIHITPLSLFTVKAIEERAAVEFPYPDPEPYQVASDVVVSGFIPADENEEYQALCRAVDEQRVQWCMDRTIDITCAFPGFSNREAMIEHFRPRLKQLEAIATLNADEWKNVLNHCVFTGTYDSIVLDAATGKPKAVRHPERNRVYQLANQSSTLPLSTPEVVEGVKLFRVEVSGRGVGKLAG